MSQILAILSRVHRNCKKESIESMRVMSPMAVKVLATLKWIMLVGYVILSPVGLPTIVYLWMRHSSISFFDQMANAFYGMDDFIGVSGKRFAMVCI